MAVTQQEFSNRLATGTASPKLWPEIRLIAAIRWLLATTALTIIYLDPKEPDNQTWGFTYIVLAAYVLYSSVLYFLAIRRFILQSRFESLAHWIDVAWYTLLIGMSGGTNRIFFFGFLFAILVASFRRGFNAGISVVIVSTLAITVIGFSTETASPGFEGYGFDVYRFMLRPVFLMVLGYLMAHWGESEIESKRRLALLKDITLSNPRLGADRTISSVVDRLREFFNADLVLILMTGRDSNEPVAYRSTPTKQIGLAGHEAVPVQVAGELLALPETTGAIYHRRRWPLARPIHKLEVFGRFNGWTAGDYEAICESLAETFQARSFLTMPISRHGEFSGRIYLARAAGPAFRKSDGDFLNSVIAQTNPIVENIRLVDTLASNAADQERQRIARDIHDSIIQPYIGFQIALSGLRRRIDSGQLDIVSEIEQLTRMASIGVTDLRRYVSKLKTGDDEETTLAAALDRFTRRFSEATGIKVQVNLPSSLRLNDSLAAEVFQMISEGLSNVRKHTEASHAVVMVEFNNRELRLRIKNDVKPASSGESFTPRSISERASSLNGVARVERTERETIVSVDIPL